MNKLPQCITFLLLLLVFGCKEDPLPEPVPAPAGGIQPGQGMFITAEGNFQFGNAAVYYWKPGDTIASGDLFQPANQRPLGDVCHSMTIVGNRAYVVVNNSGKIEAVNLPDFKSTAVINGFTSPRYLLPVNTTKAYVTDLYANAISVVDLSTNTITGSIQLNGKTEQLLMHKGEVFVTNTETDKLYIINPQTDQLTDSIPLAKGGSSMVLDANNKIWVLCSGNWQGTLPGGLFRINPVSHQVEQSWSIAAGSGVKGLCTNQQRDQLYYIQTDILRMNITDQQLPLQAFITSGNRNFYTVSVLPSGDVIAADAIDYVQRSRVYRYSSAGAELQSVRAGIISGSIVWY
jgi:DNA-binding beta-propeller fold protein YncE